MFHTSIAMLRGQINNEYYDVRKLYLIVRDENLKNPFRPFLHVCKTASIFRLTASQKQKILKSYRKEHLRI